MNFKRSFVIFLSAATLIVLVSVSIFGDKSESKDSNVAQKNQGVYQVNQSGQTYGKFVDPSVEPDLISAIGIDGKNGYVLSSDLIGSDPATPEEAVKHQMEKEKGNQRIPLYDKDGKTVIGQFELTTNE